MNLCNILLFWVTQRKSPDRKVINRLNYWQSFFYKWTSYRFGRAEFVPEKQILITEPVRNTLKVSISVDETYCRANNLLDDSATFLEEYIIHHCYNNWEAKMWLISFFCSEVWETYINFCIHQITHFWNRSEAKKSQAFNRSIILKFSANLGWVFYLFFHYIVWMLYISEIPVAYIM